MSDLHAIFRLNALDGTWDAYSRPTSVHAGGRSLDQARDEFLRAAAFHFDGDWTTVTVVEHTEREIASGVFVRIARDRHVRERERTADVLRASLTVGSQLETTRSGALESSTGDVVFVSCVPGDRLVWLADQLARTDAVQVCAPVGDNMVWWMPLASPHADVPPNESETLADAGLGGHDATVADLLPAAREFQDREPPRQAIARPDGRTLVAV